MIPSTEDRQAVIEYRKERAYLSLKEAEFVASGNFWNLAANRLYYSAFYISSKKAIIWILRKSEDSPFKPLPFIRYMFGRTARRQAIC